ncbi:MAG: UTRA domain-containing protein [Woeseiaceae bacterium]|nr:UTRA domain-containing protein [Woeseiaceae bacterium]NIP22146.1 UTRA domain-containing protein [Woeseiaceae bacterium]NIS91313.1 UTRA domain-containing protein [Woeseiaceae bacterium]
MTELLSSLKSEWNRSQNGLTDRSPLYHRLYTVLKAAILDGTIPYDAQMPTEQQLVATFDVSRITAKRAMDDLAAENLVARFRGKGSHVIYQYNPKAVRAPLVGMLENLVEIARLGTMRVVTTERAVPPAGIRQILALADHEVAQKVVRICSNEHGEAYAYYRSWTIGVHKGFTRNKLEKHTRLEMLRENGIHLTQVKQVISAESASARIAEELGVEVGAALLWIRRIGHVDSGDVVDVFDGLYNPERFQYVMISSFD